ncbi:MAG: hypothetical protein U0931_24995 [Vulcanimicrobiota bacterium]
MKRIAAGVLLLAGLSWATPPRKLAMVLTVRGNVTNRSVPVLTGQLWSQGDSISLGPGSQVTVLLLNRGERQEISGKGALEVAEQGLTLRGACSARVLPSTQLKVSLNGENQRQCAGMVLRGAVPIANSAFDRVLSEPEGLKLARAAAAGNPPRLTFKFLKQYDNPTLSLNLKSVKLPPPAKAEDTLFATEIEGQAQGDRWVWEVAWPPSGPSARALEVLETSTQTRQLYTRIYQCSPEERLELAAAREQVSQWAQKEPGTIGPYVYLACLLEEKGDLESALEALQPGLAGQPKDEGLVQMRARLLTDLGRYGDAARALKSLGNLGPEGSKPHTAK